MTLGGLLFFAGNILASAILQVFKGSSLWGVLWFEASVIATVGWTAFRLCTCRCPRCHRWLRPDRFRWMPEVFICKECGVRWSVGTRRHEADGEETH
jgi:hypothetical protein